MWETVMKVRRVTPLPLARLARWLFLVYLDVLDVLSRRPNCPPRRLIWAAGADDFEKVGQEFKDYFIDLCDLKPHEKVLDVGCGAGRMARPLTGYLGREGSYFGIDILRDSINWCNANISPAFPNFTFQCVDVLNPKYNPTGKTRAAEYRFPFPESCFDFVFLTSVFTHMLPEDVANYVREISRVLKPDGRCLITFFLLNQESRSLIGMGKSTIQFPLSNGICVPEDERQPEHAMAYDEGHVRELFNSSGIPIKDPIRYGSWCGRSTFTSYQDIVIAKQR
jgi:SAM-dependent methyltransferase